MLALAIWWLKHWDHHTRIVLDATYGPFRACGYDGYLSKSGGRAGHIDDHPGEPSRGVGAVATKRSRRMSTTWAIAS